MGCSTCRLNPQLGYPHCLFNGGILLANPNQWYFNSLVKTPYHKTPYRCPYRLSLSSQSSRSCAGPNIKVLKDKVLEFANSIRALLFHFKPQAPEHLTQPWFITINPLYQCLVQGDLPRKRLRDG
jgi:hypothetical protein